MFNEHPVYPPHAECGKFFNYTFVIPQLIRKRELGRGMYLGNDLTTTKAQCDECGRSSNPIKSGK